MNLVSQAYKNTLDAKLDSLEADIYELEIKTK